MGKEFVLLLWVSKIESDGIVPEEAAYRVGSSMPGDEHVAIGRNWGRHYRGNRRTVPRRRSPCYAAPQPVRDPCFSALPLGAAVRPRD